MLDRDRINVAGGVNIEQGVLVEISRLGDWRVPELDVQGICIREVLDLRALNPLSKNALCTVSPSARSTTRKTRPSASVIFAQRRIRPSTCIDSFTGRAVRKQSAQCSVRKQSAQCAARGAGRQSQDQLGATGGRGLGIRDRAGIQT